MNDPNMQIPSLILSEWKTIERFSEERTKKKNSLAKKSGWNGQDSHLQ
jgi:hypothetical protein